MGGGPGGADEFRRGPGTDAITGVMTVRKLIDKEIFPAVASLFDTLLARLPFPLALGPFLPSTSSECC